MGVVIGGRQTEPLPLGHFRRKPEIGVVEAKWCRAPPHVTWDVRNVVVAVDFVVVVAICNGDVMHR